MRSSYPCWSWTSAGLLPLEESRFCLKPDVIFFPGLTTGDCKDLTWQVPWKLPSPQQTWCTSKALQSLKAVAVKASALPSWQWPCSKPVCNPSPCSSFRGVFFWERKKKSRDFYLRLLCPELILGKGVGTRKTLFSTLTQRSVLSHS